MENLVNDLTQKDESKAAYAAKALINNKDIEAFKKLSEKSGFLFDFVKNNVRRRIRNAITPQNYKNITAFFTIYDENYADLFADILAEFADEELSDSMFELLEKGSQAEKTYAALYFAYIPDTISKDILEEYAFGRDIQLAANAARALGAMKDENAYQRGLSLLNSQDDFEVMQAVKFLVSYGDKSAVKELLKKLKSSTMSENIAGEIPYLMPVLDMFEQENPEDVLTCFDFILIGLGEILPLSAVFDYEIFETLQYLINLYSNSQNSQIAAILLRAAEKFSTLTSNDEYIFDEQKDVKQEIKAVSELLNAQNDEFWQELQTILPKELNTENQRASAAIEIIRAMEIQTAAEPLVSFVKKSTNEQIIVQALGALKVLGAINKVNSLDILAKITDSTLRAIAASYF